MSGLHGAAHDRRGRLGRRVRLLHVPDAGETELTTGASTNRYADPADGTDVPPAVTMLTSTSPLTLP